MSQNFIAGFGCGPYEYLFKDYRFDIFNYTIPHPSSGGPQKST
jgi:hypothetical protein